MKQYVMQIVSGGEWFFVRGEQPRTDRAEVERKVAFGNKRGFQYRVYEFEGDYETHCFEYADALRKARVERDREWNAKHWPRSAA